MRGTFYILLIAAWCWPVVGAARAETASSVADDVASVIHDEPTAPPRPDDRAVGLDNPTPNVNPGNKKIPAAQGPRTTRLLAWGVLSVGEGYVAHQYTVGVWGQPTGKFHFKNDLKDGLALADEFSHLFVGYKLAQAAAAGYRWAGCSQSAAARWGALQAALYTGAVEFPLDAYNPKQGLGISDLVADLIGVGLPWYRADQDNPRWDFKVSVKPEFFDGGRMVAQSAQQYGDFIYWLTWRLSDDPRNPLVGGIGYSTRRLADGQVAKEIHLGIGTSFSEIGRLFSRRAERLLSPAEFYFLSVRSHAAWK